jgi:hypothetical protein
MKTSAGLWIDHSQTIVVTLSADGEKTEHIKSDVEKHVRYSGGSRFDGAGNSLEEDQKDRHFGNHLSQYYDRVIKHIRGADAMLIFGPGEAKGELQQHLERAELSERIVGVETADKMTDRQIAAKVRLHFAPRQN